MTVLAQGALRVPGGKPPDPTAWHPRWPVGRATLSLVPGFL